MENGEGGHKNREKLAGVISDNYNSRLTTIKIPGLHGLNVRLSKLLEKEVWMVAYSGDSGHPFRSIPATYSESFRPAVPEDSGHPVGAERRWS